MAEQGLRRAVFLDRDGVINQNRSHHVLSWADVQFLPGVFSALQRLAASSFAVVVVTNQSAVGRGLLSFAQMWAINRDIAAAVAAHGGRLDGIYACPHRPDEGCLCRKPQPGMLLQAAHDLGLDLSSSYLVGDAVSDIEAALAAGCQPLLVRTGRGQAQLPALRANGYAVPVVADLAEAVAWILARHEGEGHGGAAQSPRSDT